MKAALNRKMVKPVEGDFDWEDRGDSYKECPEIEKLVGLLKGNTGIIFTNGDLPDIKKVIDKHIRGAAARVGSLAPNDVWIRMGPTGLDPKQTGFFQSLQIQTKIVKTQIEIVADKQIIFGGEKIEQSHVALLEKLKIRPFSYKMKVKQIYDKGQILKAEILDINDEDIIKAFQKTITNIASISLASGYVTKPAIPHLVANSFKNLAAVSFATDYSFPQAEALKAAAASAPAGGAGATQAAAPVEEAPVVEEEVDVNMGGLFGDEEEY